MRFRHTILCLAVALSCLTHGSDMAFGQSPALLEAYNRYNTYYEQGQYAEALPYAAEALRLGEEELGPDHPTTASLINNLALLYQAHTSSRLRGDHRSDRIDSGLFLLHALSR